MALIDRKRKYELMLTNFEQEVRRNPEADFTADIKELAAEFGEMAKESEQRLICTLLLSLYGGDTKALKRSITKVVVLKTQKATPEQRRALLCNLYDIISCYIDEDFFKPPAPDAGV